MAYIEERDLPQVMERIMSYAEQKIGKKMMPARLLLWYPKAFVSSMVVEGLVTHRDKAIRKRMLKLIRMQVSLRVACPFCIDMNSAEFKRFDITKEEIEAMQGKKKVKDITTFSYREKLVLLYAKALTSTPIKMNPKLVTRMKQCFGEREFTIVITTIAQVDYWTRVIQGFGIQPAGFLEACDLEYFD